MTTATRRHATRDSAAARPSTGDRRTAPPHVAGELAKAARMGSGARRILRRARPAPARVLCVARGRVRQRGPGRRARGLVRSHLEHAAPRLAAAYEAHRQRQTDDRSRPRTRRARHQYAAALVERLARRDDRESGRGRPRHPEAARGAGARALPVDGAASWSRRPVPGTHRPSQAAACRLGHRRRRKRPRCAADASGMGGRPARPVRAPACRFCSSSTAIGRPAPATSAQEDSRQRRSRATAASRRAATASKTTRPERRAATAGRWSTAPVSAPPAGCSTAAHTTNSREVSREPCVRYSGRPCTANSRGRSPA